MIKLLNKKPKKDRVAENAKIDFSDKLPKRLQRLSQRLYDKDFNQANPWHFENVNILDLEGNDYLREQPVPVRKAYSLQYVANHLPIIIKHDELIVGCPAQNSVEFGISIPKYLTERERAYFEERYGLHEQSLYGHHPPAWNALLEKGVKGISADIKERLEKETLNPEPDQEKIAEWRGMLLSLEALVIYAKRYADQALALASECADNKRKQELFNIYQVCNRVPLNPAETLHEAVQSYWFLYTIMNSGGEFLPLGRIDQYFYPYYKKDIDEGRISYEQAEEIVGSFLVKCNEKIVLDAKKMTMHKKGDRFKDYYWHYDEPDDSEHNKFFGQEANNRMMTCVVGGGGNC